MKRPMRKSEGCKIVTVLLWTSLMIPMSGCMSTGRSYIPKEKLSLLRESQTTKAEVIKLIGKPWHTTNDPDSGGETLTYDRVKGGLFSRNMDCQTVNLFIDDAGILRKISVNERTVNFKHYSDLIGQEKLSLLESKENQITKAEIISLIGNPDWISFGKDGKGEILEYFRTKHSMKITDFLVGPVIYWDATPDEQQRVNLFIDDENILRKITVADKPIEARGGILAK